MKKPIIIYAMRNLPPEVQAVTFAKTSRSPASFEEIADEVTEASSAEFNDKWVVGYGHSSVAEHAVLHIALENISMLGAKAVEDNRLASYTEKSTRYQVYADDSFYTPEEILGTPYESKYNALMELLMKSYQKWHATLVQDLITKDALKHGQARSKACDMIRGILPVSTTTNVGMTINARALAHTIRKLRSTTNKEFLSIANSLHATGHTEVPTLLKYTDGYHRPWPKNHIMDMISNGFPNHNGTKIVPADVHQTFPFESFSADLVKQIFENWNEWDPWPEELELMVGSMCLRMPFTILRDIQRHRMCSQSYTMPKPEYGVSMPSGIRRLGVIREFLELAAKTRLLSITMRKDGLQDIEMYPLMMCYNVYNLMHLNMREYLHMYVLRTTSAGDPEYVKLIESTFPLMTKTVKGINHIEEAIKKAKDVRQEKRQNKSN